MLILRLTSSTLAAGRFRVQMELEGEGLPRQSASAPLEFRLSPQDEEDLRWYLEDYLQCPQDSASAIAARIEQRLVELGSALFEKTFQANDDARELWASVQPRLGEVRVEVIAGPGEASALPWEMLRDPESDAVLALGARSFVRARSVPAESPCLPEGQSRPIRILFVICRPGGGDGAPFRSVAARILKGLDTPSRQACELEMLRPATFETLDRRLRSAQLEGRPFHVVHFDGHAGFADLDPLFAAWEENPDGERFAQLLEEVTGLERDRFSPREIHPREPPEGSQAYLHFENPESGENPRLVEGAELGSLLVETEVPVLVLGACRFAPGEAPTSPQTQAEAGAPRCQARAWGALAQEVVNAGVAGVLAMRFGVYVVTVAQFVADLYGALTCGRSLGEAVTLGRRQLEAEPLRSVAHDPLPLQDWIAPAIYEATPVRLFAEAREEPALAIRIEAGAAAAVSQKQGEALPQTPEVGFFGRDEMLLALDRAFDHHEIVLLHAYAGSGKTATAAEFARWYALTGGSQGPVLFMSFGQHLPLPQLLDRLGVVFQRGLEAQGIHWLTLSDQERRGVAMQILEQVPLLWVWDNVEPVTGFPAGSESAWSAEGQGELLEFLRAARGGRARFLLTSRRDEQEWLGDLPKRIPLPPLSMQECQQLARALVERRGRKLGEVEDWRPLLRFAQGNPLTLMVLVEQVLGEGLRTAEQVRAFVERLRRREAAFSDAASQGRAGSLAASLHDGFERAFDEAERRQLALLHLCRPFVDVDLLGWMGDPGAEWCLPEVRGLSREAGIALLDRAAELGLLMTRGGGYYAIHPALRWFFEELFDRYYAGRELAASRAFAEAMGELASFYHQQVEEGNRKAIAALAGEEANLLLARRLARKHGWWGCVIPAMQGLDQLYDHRGRRAEWRRLVEEIVPEFVDPSSERPLPEREQEEWSLVMQYRVQLAQDDLEWVEAERLQLIVAESDRERAQPALNLSPEELSEEQRDTIHTLAVSLERLGHICREQERDECSARFEEALELADRIGDRMEAAICAFNLGTSHMVVPGIRDLDRAEHWYRVSLDRRDERDRIGRGSCLGRLGSIASSRYSEARAEDRPQQELLRYLDEAAERYREALDLLPSDAVDELAAAHGQLGSLYGDADDLDRALTHYRESIRFAEAAGNPHDAAETRFNVAFDLTRAGRPQEALGYARAALRGLESCGPAAVRDVEQTRQLIEQIQTTMAESG
jgi:tetratricopeptide (TPR) repeat protein